MGYQLLYWKFNLRGRAHKSHGVLLCRLYGGYHDVWSVPPLKVLSKFHFAKHWLVCHTRQKRSTKLATFWWAKGCTKKRKWFNINLIRGWNGADPKFDNGTVESPSLTSGLCLIEPWCRSAWTCFLNVEHGTALTVNFRRHTHTHTTVWHRLHEKITAVCNEQIKTNS